MADPVWSRRLCGASLIVMLTALGTGCVEDCTAIGCDDRLFIVIEDTGANAVETFSGTIVLEGGEPLEFSCVEGQITGVSENVVCEFGGLVIYGSSVETIQLAITSAAGDFAATIEPAYENYYPNGEDCGGPCRNANERVVVTP